MSSTTNGMGRPEGAPANSIPFRLHDTGETVYISKVNPLLVREITRNFPPPKPPLNKMQYGEEWVDEPNELDPSYIQEKQQHDEEVNNRLIKLVIRRGVWIDWNEQKAQQVTTLRQDMEELGNTDLPEDDKLIWVMYLAVGTPEDMEELVTAVTRRSRPTEKPIQENISSFRS